MPNGIFKPITDKAGTAYRSDYTPVTNYGGRNLGFLDAIGNFTGLPVGSPASPVADGSGVDNYDDSKSATGILANPNAIGHTPSIGPEFGYDSNALTAGWDTHTIEPGGTGFYGGDGYYATAEEAAKRLDFLDSIGQYGEATQGALKFGDNIAGLAGGSLQNIDAGKFNKTVNKVIDTVTPSPIPGLGLVSSLVNPTVYDAPWGDKFNAGGGGLMGTAGKLNYDNLVNIYDETQKGTPGYNFYTDEATGQAYGVSPGPGGYGQVLSGTLPEGVNTPSDLTTYFDTQAANKAEAAKFVQDNNITSNDDGSFTWNDVGGISGNDYTTNVTDSTGKPSLPSDAFNAQTQAKQAEQQAAEQAAIDAANAKAAQEAAAAKAAAQAAAAQAAQQQSNNDDGGWSDPGTSHGGAAHGGGYGGYADDAGASNDGGGGGGGGTYCCTASVKQKIMTNRDLFELHNWHHSQSKWWTEGYDVWGRWVAKNLVSKCKYFAKLTKAFHNWKVDGKFSCKASSSRNNNISRCNSCWTI